MSLVFASVTGLLACPQLLSDDFDSVLSTGDDSCARRQTCASSGAGGSIDSGGGDAGASGASAGAGGSTSGAGGTGAAGSSGAAGSTGVAGSAAAGMGGSGGSGGSGDNAPADASTGTDPSPDCWLVKLDDSTHIASDNCLSINGWNQVVTDPATPDTVVSTTYEDDGVCFTGTIVNQGWGAVFNLTLNDEEPWDAVSHGVGGFQLEAEGASLPPEIQVKYTDADAGDFCRTITPAADVQVPFASAHPNCSTSSTSVSDAVDLTYIRLVMPAAASDYAIDFCLEIRAIP